MAVRPGRLFWLLVSLIAIWLVFGVLWWAPLILAESLARLGGEMPLPTRLTVDVARAGGPLLAALGATAVAVGLFWHGGGRAGWMAAALAGLAALWVAVALWAMTLPFQICGFHWPDLPWQHGTTEAVCRLPD